MIKKPIKQASLVFIIPAKIEELKKQLLLFLHPCSFSRPSPSQLKHIRALNLKLLFLLLLGLSPTSDIPYPFRMRICQIKLSMLWHKCRSHRINDRNLKLKHCILFCKTEFLCQINITAYISLTNWKNSTKSTYGMSTYILLQMVTCLCEMMQCPWTGSRNKVM